MTRKRFERRAGVRFGHLIRQLIDDGWTVQGIADAIGCDATLVSKWRYRGSSSAHDLTRKGINDAVIQGIHDGLKIRSDYLFMAPKGQSDRVRLSDGTERPCEPGELDHKNFRVAELEEGRAKRAERAVAELTKRLDASEARQDDANQSIQRLTHAVELVLERMQLDQSLKRNTR